MKKVLSFVLATLMVVSALVLTVSAKDPYGTVIEVDKATTAPSMDEALPDASWGSSLAHVDKNTVNAGLTEYKVSHLATGKVKQDLCFDMYAKWTEDTLYICFTSPDTDPTGAVQYWCGDGIQLLIYPGIIDISYKNGVETGWTTEAEFELYDWCATFAIDDESLQTSDIADDHAVIYYDERESMLVVKFEIPLEAVGFSKKVPAKAGDILSFAMLRVDGCQAAIPYETPGWLEWGNFFDSSKGWNDDPVLYITAVNNAKTTTANSIKFVDSSSSSTPAKEEPKEEPKQDTPATTTEKPSSWAAEEVNASIALGLVPTELQKSYTTGITRGQLALMLTSLLQKAGVTMPTATGTASFTDTTDANVLAAANLGIINGYKQADGTYMFKPNNTLKRSEMSAIINRVAKLCGKTTTGFEKEVTFTDTASHWCNSELGYPVHMGIVKGTSATTFSPENTLTIEQTIMMVYRTLNALAK